MSATKIIAASFALAAVLAAPAVAGEKWLKIMPDDPYSEAGRFHLFDIDSVFEDRATGYVASRMIYVKPETVADTAATSWMVWAFDCTANTVYYVSSGGESGTKVTEGWRNQPHSLDEPQMGGVTNMFGRKLCALKGSWPKGDLP